MKNFKERHRVNDKKEFNSTAYSPERGSGKERITVHMKTIKQKKAT